MSDSINPDHYKRLPVEAIHIIESAIDNAPSAQDAYLHGQVLKYVLRCWHKNGIEDLRKAKRYLDRLIEHCDELLLDANKGLVKAWTCENGKAKQVYPEQPQLPHGWRWLDEDEVIRKGDKYRDLKSQTWIECVCSVGDSLQDFHKPTIRRNRFEVGEKVVRVSNGVVYKVIRILSMGYQLESEFCAEVILHAKYLAPYIEETT